MTENQKKSHIFLMRLKRYRREHNNAIERIEALRFACLPGAMRYDTDIVQSSPINKMETLLVETIDKERELEVKHSQYLQKVKFVETVCRSFGKKESCIIMMYYIYDLPFAEISKQMGLTERHIYRLKNTALEDFAQHIVC